MQAAGARRWQRFRAYDGQKTCRKDDEQVGNDGDQLLEGHRQELHEPLQFNSYESRRRRASEYSGEIVLMKCEELHDTEQWVSENEKYRASTNISKAEKLSSNPKSPITKDACCKGWSRVDDQVSSVPFYGSWRSGFKKMLRKPFMPFNHIESTRLWQHNHKEVPENYHILCKESAQLREMDANNQHNIHKSGV